MEIAICVAEGVRFCIVGTYWDWFGGLLLEPTTPLFLSIIMFGVVLFYIRYFSKRKK